MAPQLPMAARHRRLGKLVGAVAPRLSGRVVRDRVDTGLDPAREGPTCARSGAPGRGRDSESWIFHDALHERPSTKTRRAARKKTPRLAGHSESPLTDSNRRPPPYHALRAATGCSPRQRFSLVSAPLAAASFATGCHRLQPRGSMKAPSCVVGYGYIACWSFPSSRRSLLNRTTTGRDLQVPGAVLASQDSRHARSDWPPAFKSHIVTERGERDGCAASAPCSRSHAARASVGEFLENLVVG